MSLSSSRSRNMGGTYQHFLVLHCILTTVAKNVTVMDGCEEQLLIASEDKLIKFCPSTNKTENVAQGRFKRISYSPRDGGTIVTHQGSKLKAFVQVNSVNATWTPDTTMDLGNQPEPCDNVSAASLYDMVIDWVTGIVYATYTRCGKIRAYDLKSCRFSTVREELESYPLSIATSSQRGFLIWTEPFYIFRALLDGTEEKVLMEASEYAFVDLAVDQPTSLVYWTNRKTRKVWQCDLEGQNRRVVNPSGPDILTQGFTVQDSTMFWREKSSGSATAVYRFDVRKAAKLQVYNGDSIEDLEILTGRLSPDFSIPNPCANNSCSHICVPSSSNKEYTCLCPDNYALERDGKNCNLVQRHLLVSATKDGIWQIPVLYGNASEPRLVVKSASNATNVQCDPARRKILWAEGYSYTTRILQVDLENPEKGPVVVFEHSISVRVGDEELEAFAVDWITGNLYMAFRGERRILACGRGNESTTYSKCAELFGNRLGLSISGLALAPNHGTMYWTQLDEEDTMVIRGGMDGSWMEILKKGGLPKNVVFDDRHFRLYWLNQARERFEYIELSSDKHFDSFKPSNYEAYTPQRIVIDRDDLYWVGLAKAGGSSETVFRSKLDDGYSRISNDSELIKYVDRDFTNITGLWMCDAHFKRAKRTKTCGNDSECAGLCLLSGRDSFRCVCPIGFENKGANGSSCREIEEPALIYSREKELVDGSIYIKNGLHENLIYEGPVSTMAFDPVRRELFWSFTDRVNQSFRQNLTEMRTNWTQAAGKPFPFQFRGPAQSALTSRIRQLEYDWIGENLYFFNWRRGVGLCSTVTGECAIAIPANATFALDPPNGCMYWILWVPDYLIGRGGVEPGGIWRGEMDGSGGTLILPHARAVDITVDRTSKLLWWRTVGKDRRTIQLFYSDLDGGNVRPAMKLHGTGGRIRVTGSRLWMYISSFRHRTRGILSFDKLTGDNLRIYELELADGLTDFLILNGPTHVQKDKDFCISGALCSHMCVHTPSGYMRCLCPTGYRLTSNERTCECADASVCNMSNPDKQPPLSRLPTSSDSEENAQKCKGNQFPCTSHKCVGVDKLCNGLPDCRDFSDEGARCNEPCKGEYGCSHNCSRSPEGPICFCPPEQMLANDSKSCVVLEIRTEPGPAEGRLEGKWKVVLISGGAVSLILAIVVVVVTLKYHQAKRERELTQEELDEFLGGNPAAAALTPDGVDRALLLPYTKILSPDDIIIARDTKLGSGEFGVVYPGIFRSDPVAIKVLKQSVDVEDFKAVLAEVKIMAYLGDHEFVVKFIGAETSEIAKRKIMIVTELSPKGDLLRYLWKVASVGLETPPGMYQNVAGNPSGVTIHTLYSWCEQIATGMEYLAQKQIVHGDLAARNVLVFKDNVVKIADFGLSKQLYGCTSYLMKRQRKLPWKWSAIELLQSGEFSEASDVWAFGVTAWEIFTLGQTPYKCIAISNTFLRYIEAGHRLPKPTYSSEEIYKVLLECWDTDRSNRPNFHRLKQIFHDFGSEQQASVEPVVSDMGPIYVTAV